MNFTTLFIAMLMVEQFKQPWWMAFIVFGLWGVDLYYDGKARNAMACRYKSN